MVRRQREGLEFDMIDLTALLGVLTVRAGMPFCNSCWPTLLPEICVSSEFAINRKSSHVGLTYHLMKKKTGKK